MTIQLSQIKSQKYASGTRYLERNGAPAGTDKINLWGNEGERIVPTKDNVGIPRSFPNSMLSTAVNYFLDSSTIHNRVIALVLSAIVPFIIPCCSFTSQIKTPPIADKEPKTADKGISIKTPSKGL